MKGGTTSLFHYLASHPDISGAILKETNYFIEEKNYWRGGGWYASLFPCNSGGVSFEASPNYTKRHLFPGVAERINKALPNVKLIYIVRNPLERTISHYLHSIAAGSETRSFIESIRNPRSNYVLTSKYYYQIEPYALLFDHRNILIVDTGDLKDNPRLVLSEISNFLEIEDRFDINIAQERFHLTRDKYLPSQMERLLIPYSVNPHWRKLVRGVSRPFRKPLTVPTVSQVEVELLRRYIASDLKQFEEFCNRSFAEWRAV